MIFETDLQAQFLIPMAISLGFGVLFVTVVVLLILPCFYLIMHDFVSFFRRNPSKGQGQQVEPELKTIPQSAPQETAQAG